MDTGIALLEAARKMNRGALIKIFDHYSPALFKYALCLCHDPLEADHIVGDVFAKLLDQLSAGGGPRTNLRSYLYQMTYHLVVDGARSSHREVPLDIVEFTRESSNTILTDQENRILFDAVVLAVRNDLTDDQRHVIVLRFIEGFSIRDTAEIIGKTVQNIKIIQNRGIAKLRKVLGAR